MTRKPKGLGYYGGKLYDEVTSTFDLDESPEKRRILYDAARTADFIDRLEKEAKGQPMTACGSYGQPVVNPLLAAAQSARSSLAALLSRLNFEEISDGDA